MTARLSVGLMCLAAWLLSACNEARVADSPCAVASRQDYQFQEGTQLNIWNIEASRLQQLTVRLLTISNGQIQESDEIEYTWDAWTQAEGQATGQVLFLSQNPSAAATNSRQVPLLSADFQQSPAHTRTERYTGLPPLQEDLQPGLQVAKGEELLSASEENILYAALLFDPADPPSSVDLSPSIEPLITASQGNRTVLAVGIQCVPLS